MRLKCLLGKHEPAGENILPYKSCTYNWIKKCKGCNRYIAEDKDGEKRIMEEWMARAVVTAEEYAHMTFEYYRREQEWP